MHELSVARNILEILFARMEQLEKGASAQSIQVTVGEFRNVDPQSLTFAFDSLKLLYPGCGTCELVLLEQPASAICAGDGQHIYRPQYDSVFRCTECGAGISSLRSGEELLVTGITIETTEEKQHA